MENDLHAGHRKRMLKRLIEHEESLEDHELLEIVLYNVIPRRNTNEIAHRLLKEFGSLAAIFRADYKVLAAVPGVGEATAAYLQGLVVLRERVQRTQPAALSHGFNISELNTVVAARLQDLRFECIELYAVDKGGLVYGVDRYTSHKTDRASLTSENLIEFLYKYAPYSVLFAHNHLTENCNPSHDDDLFTRSMVAVCKVHNIRLLDHVIVSARGVYSYVLSNRMDYIKGLPVDF